MKNVTVLGIDLAKEIFQLHGADANGHKVFSKRLRRNKLATFIAKLNPCLIGMEACGGAHHWARTFREIGHDVKLMSPQFVKPFVKTNKNDSADAEACSEAVIRPTMRFVGIKTIEQQDIQTLHRIRERLLGKRTQLSNQIRGFLLEYGIDIAKGFSSLKRKLPEILSDEENVLTDFAKELFRDLQEEFNALNERITFYTDKVEKIANTDERCVNLQSAPGIGPITSTIFIAAVGEAQVFSKGRQLSAWLGLVPKHVASGNTKRLLGISKRGDRYLRSLFIHGARSVVSQAKKQNKMDAYSLWIKRLVDRCGINKAVVAVANKNARIAWALMRDNTTYQSAKFLNEQDISCAGNAIH